MSDSDLTDPGLEISDLIRRVRGFDGTPASGAHPAAGWLVFSRGIGIAAGSANFYEILAAMRGRVERLEGLLGRMLELGEVRPEIVETILPTLERVAAGLSPAHLSNQWVGFHLETCFKEEDARLLVMLSAAIRPHSALRKLSDFDRGEALEAVAEGRDEAERASGLDTWQRKALIEGYDRLELVLRYFEYFGHEGLQREHAIVSASLKGLEASKPEVAAHSGSRLWRAMVLIAQIIEVGTAPASAIHGYLGYTELARLGAPQSQAAVLMIEGPKVSGGEKRD